MDSKTPGSLKNLPTNVKHTQQLLGHALWLALGRGSVIIKDHTVLCENWLWLALGRGSVIMLYAVRTTLIMLWLALGRGSVIMRLMC